MFKFGVFLVVPPSASFSDNFYHITFGIEHKPITFIMKKGIYAQLSVTLDATTMEPIVW